MPWICPCLRQEVLTDGRTTRALQGGAFTDRGGETRLVVASRYLPPGTRVAIIDDFLANGKTAVALAEIVSDAGAHTVVAGFLVEKLFQNGRAGLEELGIPVATLARVKLLREGRVIMADD